jgi:hypothetical protein
MTLTKTLPNSVSLTIRRATPQDIPALVRLAALDSAEPLIGDILVADVSGELWAAVALSDFRAVGDPFRPSAELTFLLIERARQVRGTRRRTRRRFGRLALA